MSNTKIISDRLGSLSWAKQSKASAMIINAVKMSGIISPANQGRLVPSVKKTANKSILGMSDISNKTEAHRQIVQATIRDCRTVLGQGDTFISNIHVYRL